MCKKKSQVYENRAIISILSAVVEKNPEMRFHQLLQEVGIEDPSSNRFEEESATTLENLISHLKHDDEEEVR